MANLGRSNSSASARSQHRPDKIGASHLHLVYSEINAVTSAIRKHARNTASSSFLGSSSGATAGIGGPVAGGSSTASLLKNAVVAASASYVPVPPQTAANGLAGQEKHDSSITSAISDQASRSAAAHSRNRSLDLAFPAQSGTITRQRYVYADGRRDDSLAGLLNAFTVLRAQLREVNSLHSIPQPLLLLPFLRVILSPRTTGPVTSIALQAVHRLLIYNIVHAQSAHNGDGEILATRQDGRDHTVYLHRSSSQLGVAEIAHAVSHCRFEASDAVTDELVLLRILAVMRELICNDGQVESVTATGLAAETSTTRSASIQALADSLSDESICEMMETGLSMCCQMRLSDLLRRTAEQSMTTMVRALFSRLANIPLAADEAYSSDPDVPEAEPEHATLAADPVGEDALTAEMEKKLRRMTMPDPKSFDVPAAGLISPTALQELKFIGEQEGEQEGTERPVESAEVEVAASSTASGPALASISAVLDAAEEKQSEKPADEVTAAPSAPESVHQPDTPRTESGAIKEEMTHVEVQAFGLPAVKEVLRVIISLLDPHNEQHTDAMRLLGLSMLGSVLEVAGKAIGQFPTLRALVQDSACKHLFQLSRSGNATLVSYSLRTISTLFETMREHLKLQYELFMTHLLDRLAPTFPVSAEPWKDDASNVLALRRANLIDERNIKRAGTPDTSGPAPPPPPPPPPLPRTSDRAPAHGETRDLTIEAFGMLLGSFASDRVDIDAFVELWINYDCNVECENMFEQVIHFLCRAVYATNPLHPHVQESTQLFAIDAILNFVSSLAARQETDGGGGGGRQYDASWPEGLPTPESLNAQKSTKASILAGAGKFNEKPKDGLKYFESMGFINPVDSATRDLSVARFLKECPKLDKKLLGDFLSRPNNEGILDAFLRLFDFSQTPIAEALREMLEAFRLPGESQQIARITETFAKIYFASHPAEIKNEDAVYVLSYSIIMLNTDLHNPQNRRRMTIEDYRRNLRGVNDGANFDEEFLEAIYDSIRRREIVMPEEHKGQLGFDYTWKELLRRSRKASALLCTPTTRFDKAMFGATWRPIVASIAHAFSTYRDEHVLERAISGFRQCAILASRFGMHELFDFMIQGLAGATGLLDANGVGQVTNNAVIDYEGQRVTISPLSIQFGRNFKGQLAAVVLFTIANGNGHAVRKGWLPIFEIFKNLFINSLLSPSLGVMFEFGVLESRALPVRAKRTPGPPPQDPRSQSGVGIFSTISSYLLSPYSGEKEVTKPDVSVNEEAVESSLCTADCVASCRIEDLFAELHHLNQDARLEALEALRQLADRYTVERRASLLADGQGGSGTEPSSGRSTPVQGGSSASAPLSLRANQPLPYDPCGAFVLELASTLACSASPSDAGEVWPILSGHIASIISSPAHYHSLQVERAVVSLLRLVQYASVQADLRQQIFLMLDKINGLPVEYRATVAVQVTAGVRSILSANPAIAVSKTEWSVILSLLTAYGNARSSEAAHHALAALQPLLSTDAEPIRITSDNFAGVVSLLHDFARTADTAKQDGTPNGAAEAAQQARQTLTEKKALREYELARQERGATAVQALESLRSRIPRLAREAHLTSAQDVWQAFWLPLMLAIAQQYSNGHRATRQAALTYLQRILLAPELFIDSSSTSENRAVVHSLFQSVVFPTLHELLKPEVFQLDPGNESGSMQETRIRACNLLCKVYLHYLGRLTDGIAANEQVDQSFLELWLTILDFFDRFMHSGKRDQLTESTPENVKNVLLVMNASDVLLPPTDNDRRTPGQQQLFDQTFERIHRFLPKLKEEIFAPVVAPAATQAPQAEAEPPTRSEEDASVPATVEASQSDAPLAET